jgi:5-methylcytosine-specific restriction enzyme B
MAKLKGAYATALYTVADQWRTDCLSGGGSLLWSGEQVWSKDALTEFKEAFIDRPDEGNETFEAKFERQLKDYSELVTKLACELLLVYFLFTASVRGSKKRKVISAVAGWKASERG